MNLPLTGELWGVYWEVFKEDPGCFQAAVMTQGPEFPVSLSLTWRVVNRLLDDAYSAEAYPPAHTGHLPRALSSVGTGHLI